MIRKLKVPALHAMRAAGLYGLVRDSRWRRRRLVILCYHGISIDDEHAWDPALYMRPSMFERRLQILKEGGYNVLPLGEAVRRMYDGTLPPRAVALTFDDGAADFAARAWPLLQRYELPATVYLTTYYSDFQAPIFDVFIRYAVWKSGVDEVDVGRWIDGGPRIDVRGRRGLGAFWLHVTDYTRREDLSGAEKADLAERIARDLGVDYDAVLARRILHIMDPDEVRRLADEGLDVQLHTHRHRSPTRREEFLREIEDNRARIRTIVGSDPLHFCYPMGLCRPEYPVWLKDTDVATATVTENRGATAAADPHRIPRVVDTENMSEVEFEGFLSGARELVPRDG